MTSDIIHIDFHKVRMTMAEVFSAVEELQRTHPDQEIFMDGDAFAIVGRVRA